MQCFGFCPTASIKISEGQLEIALFPEVDGAAGLEGGDDALVPQRLRLQR